MEKIEKETGIFTASNVLWYLVFTGFAVNYMVRTNLNIAIVSMIKSPPKTKEIIVSECFNATTTSLVTTSRIYNATQNFTELGKPLETKTSKKFAWDEKKQSSVLGAYFWLHWLTQIPGGVLAQKYGTKKVYGLSNFAGALFCFVIPFSAYLGHYYLIFVRVLQGLVTGFCWPSMHNMTAKWIPPNERSKFVSAYLGSSIGSALTYPICGYIIDVFGWEMAFYVCGVIGTIWYIAWFFLVFDSPQEHPRISEKERDYIVGSLGKNVSKERAPIPWRHLLTSGPVWMNILAQWGGLWGFFTLMTHTPTYFKMVHGWNIRSTGWLSGLPHLMRMLFAFAFSHLGDYLLRAEKMTRTNVRKFATTVCCIGQGICLLGLSYSGCNKITAIVFLTMATAANGAVSTGPLASLVDLSPNYASVAFGFCNTTVASIGFLTPIVVGYLTFGNQSVGQWQKVFWIATGMLMASGIVYILFSKSEVQPWNDPENMKKKQQDLEKPVAELEPLKPTENEKEKLRNDEKSEEEQNVKECK